MENLENIQQADSHLIIDSEIKGYLIETSKWGKFLAIVGYVGIGLMLILGVLMLIGFSIFNNISDTDFPVSIIGFIYIIIAAIYYFPFNYLYKFSNLIKQGFNTNNNQSVTTGFENLKSLFKFMGIFTIIILSIYALVIIIAVPIGIIAASR